MKDKIIAVVPARGGSKRLPGKNLKPLGGRPLAFHTLDALIGHNEISKIIFTSDSEEYLQAVELEYGDLVSLVCRPDYYGADTTKVYDEIVRLADNNILENDWFMLCLPTSPFRSYRLVRALLDEWSLDLKPRFSASEYGFPVQFSFDIDSNGNWIPDMDDSPMITGNTRSQDIPKRYRPNGAMYLQKVSSLYKNMTFYIDAVPFVMSESDSIDIDNAEDFAIAEVLWEMRIGQ